jgi:hypothetical protein
MCAEGAPLRRYARDCPRHLSLTVADHVAPFAVDLGGRFDMTEQTPGVGILVQRVLGKRVEAGLSRVRGTQKRAWGATVSPVSGQAVRRSA